MKPISLTVPLRSLVLVALALTGCSKNQGADLVFGQQESVGLTISGSAPQAGGGLTLGYSSIDIAVIPVVVETPGGGVVVKGETKTLDDKGGSAGGLSDALSTLGQFDLDTGDNGTASVGLGQFFATGNAAQILAQGFAGQMSATPPAGK